MDSGPSKHNLLGVTQAGNCPITGQGYIGIASTDVLTGRFVDVELGTGRGQRRLLRSYDPKSKLYDVERPWTKVPTPASQVSTREAF
jgi:hypothetical protein